MFWGQKFKRTDNCSFVHKLHGDGQTEASHNWEVWEAKVLQGGATSALCIQAQHQGMDDIRGIRRVVVVPGTSDEGRKEENSSHHRQLLLS